jgi:peptide/nickel transport system substrate-binding protein
VSISGNRVVDTVGVGRGPSSLAAHGDDVWVTNALDSTVSRIDVATGVVTSTAVGAEPSAIVAAEGVVWVANAGDATLERLDPASGDVVGSVSLTSSPAVLALEGDALATGTKALASAHRGGELRVLSGNPIHEVDPAVWDGSPADSLGLTHDALLAPRHVGGAAGLALVPSLATSLPVPTDGGRTYTFVLRRGIHFSDGSPLRASDVAHSVRRAFALSEWAGSMLRLAGLGRCKPGSGTCELGRSVEADDAAGTVSFHLAEPDPDFFYKISGPWFWVVPRTTPLGPVRSADLPGTGPYRLAEVSLAPRERPGASRVVLERNPHFAVWSAAARPDGFVDRIVVRGELSEATAFGAVARNEADVAYYTEPPPAMVDELETTYTARRHVLPTHGQAYFFLNTRVPPFDDVDVRRAVAFALDRARAAGVLDHRNVVSCQLLPSSLPGHEPTCPYTREPTTQGTWDAPDLVRAQDLVERSGTVGASVTIAIPERDRPTAGVLAEALRDLGYEVSVRVIPGDPYSGYFTEVSNPESRVQAGPVTWFPDIPTPNSVFEPLVTCRGFANTAHFCDRDLDALIERAKRVQGRNPGAANELWAEVDRRVLDASPLVPYATRAFVDLVSDRVGNYQYNPLIGPLLGQMWVQ